jgi:hypothetical protein
MTRRPGSTPKERREAESKTRRDGGHCPVCLQRLARLSSGTPAGVRGSEKGRLAHKCSACGAERQPGKRCARCHEEGVWEADAKAACQACGHHGSRVTVVAGALEDNR